MLRDIVARIKVVLDAQTWRYFDSEEPIPTTRIEDDILRMSQDALRFARDADPSPHDGWKHASIESGGITAKAMVHGDIERVDVLVEVGSLVNGEWGASFGRRW